ncbi:5-dehydro-2-deoxygluconokinase [Leucothrix sargassi]|nr:5-dehydro-2-deoxygluconokinase [Leucothrix sargassi]
MTVVLDPTRPLDVICLGRAGVDLYANEHDVDFTDVTGFTKYVGGSSANIVIALAKLNCKVGFISALSDDMLGAYVRDYLTSKGVDLQGVQTSPEGSRTSLAITEMKADNCGVVIYRNQAADLELDPAQISEAYIASAKMLVMTGTALAQSPSREATFAAIEFARNNGTKVVLDLDYRAYSWVSLDDAAQCLRKAASLSDIVIGNREEFDVLEHDLIIDSPSDDDTAKRFLSYSTQMVVLKAGHLGSKTYTLDDECIQQGIYPVEVVKPFGAGDSFAGSLLYSMVEGLPLAQGLRMGAAAASINVSSDNCTEAMPTLAELEAFLNDRS